MKSKTILFVLMLFFGTAWKTDKPAYVLFNAKGQKVKYNKLLKSAKKSDIIFFGEQHNNTICHWLQLELTNDLYKMKGDDLIMGAEMFEADNQLILDEYLKGKIPKNNFEKEIRSWPNYYTDYSPLVEFAKEKNLSFIATNIPRRYAAIVHKEGFDSLDSLSDAAKKYITPLPIKYDPELKGYKQMLVMMKGSQHTNANLPKAQAIKDATMAYFILKNFSMGKTFIHFNGAYHSKNYEGIVWYLKQENPDLNILTISTEEQKELYQLDEQYKNTADYILVVPEDMTKTY